MNVAHYDEDYGDSLPESLTEEFSPEVATAVLTSDQLTPHLRSRLIDTAHHAREGRHALLQDLDSERTALNTADDNLARLGADPDDVLSARSFHAWPDEDLATARDCLHARQQECDQLAADRQATLREQRIPGTHHIDHEFAQYLYETLPITFPVLTDIASLAEMLHNAQKGIERALNARNSETPNP
jgi:hypothetical protein